MFSLTDYLTLREQLKLVEIAAEASDYDVRKHALAILNQYRNPPRFVAADGDGERPPTARLDKQEG